MKVNHILIPFALCFLLGCKSGGIFLFSIQDDINLGQQVDAEIEADPTIIILEEYQYPEAYAYLNTMKALILETGEVRYREEFPWELHIVYDDEVLNAFATPGGFIYIYTGLIRYLDDASSLAGVLGHEIAHADNRHSSRQMQKQFGIQLLFEILTGGDPGTLAQVASSLWALSFSRSDETDADNASVRYLCETPFNADGAANFFQKIIDEGSPNPPQFLSTHPNPDNRVENIEEEASIQNCETEVIEPLVNGKTYAEFKALLP